MVGDALAEFHHQSTPVSGTELAPVAAKRASRGFHRQIDVGGFTAWNVFKHLAIDWGVNRQCFATDSLAGFATDDHVCHV
jgi:hypothetical protein